MSRGQIRNELYNKQTVDFSLLRYKNITPTDIDGKLHFFEIANEVFVFIEIKLIGVMCQGGQRLAFERLTDIIPKPTIYIIAEHNVKDPKIAIMAHDCLVRECRFLGQWRTPASWRLKELIDWFLKKYGFEAYIQ